MLDMCLFTLNFHTGIIDKTVPAAQQKLEKIRFARETPAIGRWLTLEIL